MELVSNPWNSLEIVKLIISAATPIIVAILAFQFNHLIKKREKMQWTNQKIIEKRIEFYDLIVPELNDLLCYYSFIGNWKDLLPKDIIAKKRLLDKKVNIYAPLFSEEVLIKYNSFINLCFDSFTGWGHDAKIKSTFKRRKQCNPNWSDEWDDYFSSDYIKRHKEDKTIKKDIESIREQYLSLLENLKTDLEILQGTYKKNDFPTINY
jgi:hypothetical protein